jgi:hypothetical protein
VPGRQDRRYETYLVACHSGAPDSLAARSSSFVLSYATDSVPLSIYINFVSLGLCRDVRGSTERSTMRTLSLLVLLHAATTLGVATSTTPYACVGAACCGYECVAADGQCRTTPSGLLVPSWWAADSCGDYLSRNYDPNMPCSKALFAYEACGLDTPHACGYGLACGLCPPNSAPIYCWLPVIALDIAATRSPDQLRRILYGPPVHPEHIGSCLQSLRAFPMRHAFQFVSGRVR